MENDALITIITVGAMFTLLPLVFLWIARRDRARIQAENKAALAPYLAAISEAGSRRNLKDARKAARRLAAIRGDFDREARA